MVTGEHFWRVATLKRTKYEKYETDNPIIRWIASRYLRKVKNILKRINAISLIGLDIGCGAGHMSLSLHKEGVIGRMIAIDIDEERLRYAKNHHPVCEYLKADINELPLERNNFDYLAFVQGKKMSVFE